MIMLLLGANPWRRLPGAGSRPKVWWSPEADRKFGEPLHVWGKSRSVDKHFDDAGVTPVTGRHACFLDSAGVARLANPLSELSRHLATAAIALTATRKCTADAY